jgi:anaerobic selenocysteine-containing dehydrogenase
VDAAKQVNFQDNGMPEYLAVESFVHMKPNHLHLVTFKWNVHTQGRTASQKYLSEIVHHNPMWINTQTAKDYGVKTGDLVELSTFRPYGHDMKNGGDLVGKAVITVYVTEGIHPRVLAVSNSLGNLWHGRAANASKGALNTPSIGLDQSGLLADQDLDEDIWWDPRNGGVGAGYNVNAILPIQSAPLVGMQGWFDTVCSIKAL